MQPAVVLSSAMGYKATPAYRNLQQLLACQAQDSIAWPRCTGPTTHWVCSSVWGVGQYQHTFHP